MIIIIIIHFRFDLITMYVNMILVIIMEFRDCTIKQRNPTYAMSICITY